MRRWLIFAILVSLLTWYATGNAVALSSAKHSVRSSIPIALPVKQNGPITFSNIANNLNQVSKIAYESVHRVEQTNKQPSITLHVYTGPHTKPNVKNVSEAFAKTMKLWSGFQQPTKYYAVIFNYQDRVWALNKSKALYFVKQSGGVNGATGIKDRIKQCRSTRDCASANSGIVGGFGGLGFGQFGMDPSHNFTDAYFVLGGIEGHEYTHSVQAAQFLNAKRNNQADSDMQAVTPCWLIEGQANFDGTASQADTFADYMTWRSEMARGWPVSGFTDYSSASLLRFLQKTKPGKCLPPNPLYQLGYGIGALVVEALTAIGGSQSTLALLAEMGRGKSFSKAFSSVYGISWSAAAPILARVAAAEYAATP